MSRAGDPPVRNEGCRGSRIDFDEGGGYHGFPRRAQSSVPECPGNRVRYSSSKDLETRNEFMIRCT